MGDLYASVDVVLGANNPIRAGASTQFYQDTDSAATKGTIIRVPDMGSTGLLVGLGLIAVGALRRRS